jgi:hypothetical protein
MNLKVLSYYANLLGVSIDYLLYTDRSKVSSLDAEILKMMEYFSDEEKEKLVKVLHVLKDTK